MDKSGAKFKFVGHSTEIIRQSENKGTLPKKEKSHKNHGHC